MNDIFIDKIGVEMPSYTALIELSTINSEYMELINWYFRNYNFDTGTYTRKIVTRDIWK